MATERRPTFASAAPGTATALQPEQVAIRTGRDELDTDMAAAHYLLDYGYIVKGSTRVQEVKLSNFSNEVINATLDIKMLETSGVVVTPQQPQIRLVAPPDRPNSVNYTFTLNTSKVGVNLGPTELTLPLPIKNGPPALLSVKWHAIYPDMSLSEEELEFGMVQAGNCKVNCFAVNRIDSEPEFQLK